MNPYSKYSIGQFKVITIIWSYNYCLMAAKCVVGLVAERKTEPVQQRSTSSLMKDRLVIRNHYRVVRQDHRHSSCENTLWWSFFCFLCSFHRTSSFSLWPFVFYHMCLFLVSLPSVSLSPFSHWWVVREGLSALLHQLCFKSLLEATRFSL